MNPKTRILLKISGGQLKNNSDNLVFNESLLDDLAQQIKTLSQDYQIGIVLGGGNIWRGKDSCLPQLSDVPSDYSGMLATIINGLVLQGILKNHGVRSVLFSALHCDQITSPINIQKVDESLNEGSVAIFSGGTGLPFVTTDTAAAIRALEINSKIILMGKENIKGVYDKDPNIHEDAVFLPNLSYDEIIEKNLKVMDATALTLTKEHKITWLVFNQSLKNSFVDAMQKTIEFTTISQHDR